MIPSALPNLLKSIDVFASDSDRRWFLVSWSFSGLDNPTLYRTFAAGAGLEVRQCFESGKQPFF